MPDSHPTGSSALEPNFQLSLSLMLSFFNCLPIWTHLGFQKSACPLLFEASTSFVARSAHAEHLLGQILHAVLRLSELKLGF